jgi:hypothetical protein
MDDVVYRYVELRQSSVEIARALGFNIRTISSRIERAGIPMRSHTEAAQLRAERLTPEQRLAQATAAHLALRGRTRDPAHVLKQALTNERSMVKIGEGEREMIGWLRQRGLRSLRRSVRQHPASRPSREILRGPFAAGTPGQKEDNT